MNHLVTLLLISVGGATATLTVGGDSRLSLVDDTAHNAAVFTEVVAESSSAISICHCDETLTRCLEGGDDNRVDIFSTMVAICIDAPDIGHIHDLKMTHADFQHSYIMDYKKFNISEPVKGRDRILDKPSVAEIQFGEHGLPRGNYHRVGAKMCIPHNCMDFFNRSLQSFWGRREMTINGDVELYEGSKMRIVPFSVQIPVQIFRLPPFLQDDDPWTYVLIIALIFGSYLIPRFLILLAFFIYRRCQQKRKVKKTNDGSKH